jgi:MtN3 and saliva related transmembrane protein
LNSIEIIGFFGGLLTTGGMVPQVVRLYKLKSAHEISLSFVTFYLTGITLWLTYGILLALQSIIIWNAIALALGFAMLYAKLRWGRSVTTASRDAR